MSVYVANECGEWSLPDLYLQQGNHRQLDLVHSMKAGSGTSRYLNRGILFRQRL